MKQPEIYIHVGLGRTGSTFLQHRVFPKIEGVYYRRNVKFKKAKKVIPEGKAEKYLISGELDNRIMESYLKPFSDPYSYAKPILVLRRHDEWIASQHRRYIKNGYRWRFGEFFDLEDERVYWTEKELYYFPVIQLLEKYFQQKPLVLLYDDLRKDPKAFISRIVDYMGAEIDLDTVDFSAKHPSYREKQLRAIYSAAGVINLKKHKPYSKKWKNVILNLWVNAVRYAILYLSILLPRSFLTKEEIFPTQEQLRAIREHYHEDWEQCAAYATDTHANR